jgi:Gas vesicle protein G
VGLLTLPFRLPFLPVTGVIRLAEIMRDEAERQYRDPAAVRRELEDLDRARASGQMTDEELREAEQRVIGRVVRVPGAGGAPASAEEG